MAVVACTVYHEVEITVLLLRAKETMVTATNKARIQRLRARTRPIAFWLFLFGLAVVIITFVIGMILNGEPRIWVMRLVGLCFGVTLSGSIVHFVFIAVDEWLSTRYGAAIWMFFWSLLLGVMFCATVRVAIMGFS